jgi:hypothetical protein
LLLLQISQRSACSLDLAARTVITSPISQVIDQRYYQSEVYTYCVHTSAVFKTKAESAYFQGKATMLAYLRRVSILRRRVNRLYTWANWKNNPTSWHSLRLCRDGLHLNRGPSTTSSTGNI